MPWFPRMLKLPMRTRWCERPLELRIGSAPSACRFVSQHTAQSRHQAPLCRTNPCQLLQFTVGRQPRSDFAPKQVRFQPTQTPFSRPLHLFGRPVWSSSHSSPLYTIQNPNAPTAGQRGNFTYVNRFLVLVAVSGTILAVTLVGSFYLLYHYVEQALDPALGDARLLATTEKDNFAAVRKYLVSALVREHVMPDYRAALEYLTDARSLLIKEHSFMPNDPLVVELTLRIAELCDRLDDLSRAYAEYSRVWQQMTGPSRETFWSQTHQQWKATDQFLNDHYGQAVGRDPQFTQQRYRPTAADHDTHRQELITLVRLATQLGAVCVRQQRYDEAVEVLGHGLQWAKTLHGDTTSHGGTNQPSRLQTYIRQTGRWVLYEPHDWHYLELKLIGSMGDAYALKGQLASAYTLYQEALTRYRQYAPGRPNLSATAPHEPTAVPSAQISPIWTTLNTFLLRGQVSLPALLDPPLARHYVGAPGQFITTAEATTPSSAIDTWACFDAALMDHLGEVSHGLGRTHESDQWFQSSLTVSEAKSGIPICDQCASLTLGHLAMVAETREHPDQAMAFWRAAGAKAESATDDARLNICKTQIARLREASAPTE
ncbi:hypothetical protein H4R34_001982 [Dimargaris verticillata]|uniref:Uncharacterized protein n=1 Tax=Dimargaris verticillata TaxID=2761393 RepID=A0A9W8B8V6_9FUNG|nr:hypothetical protein H4R34_001982 [Dimargaris verticillata]